MNEWKIKYRKKWKTKIKCCECVCVLECSVKSGKTFLKWCRRVHTDFPFFFLAPFHSRTGLFTPSAGSLSLGATIQLSSSSHDVVVIIVIVVVVVFVSLFQWFSVRVFTEMCTICGCMQYTTRISHMYTTRPTTIRSRPAPPLAQPTNKVWVFYHIWPLSFQLCAIRCHTMPCHILFRNTNAVVVQKHRKSITWSPLSLPGVYMVLKSTHTLSAFSNNFYHVWRISLIWFDLTPLSLSLIFFLSSYFHPHSLTHPFITHSDRNQWNQAKEWEEKHTPAKVIFILNDLNKHFVNVDACVCVCDLNYPDRLLCFIFELLKFVMCCSSSMGSSISYFIITGWDKSHHPQK